MSKKDKKQFKVTVDVQEERAVKHLMNAYGILCELRQAQGANRLSPERWFGTVLIEGANAIITHYNQLVKQQEETKKKETITEINEKIKEVDGDDGQSETV